MAQGAGKKSGGAGKSQSAGAAKKKSGVTRPGRFVVPPKTAQKIVAKTQEKVSGKLWKTLREEWMRDIHDTEKKGLDVMYQEEMLMYLRNCQARSTIRLRSRWFRLRLVGN